MLSWITKPRTAELSDFETQGGDQSILEPPETPAPMFAVNAFKHAIFGTPHPDEVTVKPSLASKTTSKARFQGLDDRGQKPRLRDHSSPTKPASILMTPGTVNGRRKNVSFGREVVDNEGRRPPQMNGASLPSDCPGKFPSPYTPKERQQLESKPRTTLTAMVRSNTLEQQAGASTPVKQRARDDADITLDVMEPRSQSGRYWKQAHEEYAAKSEKEMRKLLAKRKLAKDFAKKKDTEVTDLKLKLDGERKKNRIREKTWEDATKDLQERLRRAIAENAKYAAELALLRQKLDASKTADAALQPKASLQRMDSAMSTELPARSKPHSEAFEPEILPPAGVPDDHTDDVKTNNLDKHNAPDASVQAATLVPAPIQQNLGTKANLTDPTTSSGQAHQGRSSPRDYRVSKRPVTVTMARVRTPQQSPAPELGPNRQPRVSDSSVMANQADASDVDLWALSSLEFSNLDSAGPSKPDVLHYGRKALKPRSANSTPVHGAGARPQESPLISQTSEKAHTKEPEYPLPFRKGPSSPAPAGSPRHFPGSPVGRHRPSETNTLAARTNLPPSQEEAARARIAARRARRQNREEIARKANVGMHLTNLLGG